jgi:RNA polymerase sigma-70 factor (ECF subfamily)
MMGERDDMFGDLYRYYPAVCRLFITLGFDLEDARDMAQQTFLRVYEHMDSYRGESRWNYLSLVARRLAYNEMRDRAAAKRSPVVASLDDLDADVAMDAYNVVDQSDPYEDVAAKDRHEQIAVAINDLPEGARETMRWYLAGLSYEEIAQTMNVTIDAVKSRLKDARRLIKSMLDRTS